MAMRPHILTQWGGQLGNNSGEIWTNSIRWVTNGTDVNDLQGLAETWNDVFVPALVNHIKHPDSGYSSNAQLQWVKINAVGNDGRQPAPVTNAAYAPADFTATRGVGPVGPPQLALTITFTTAVERGLAARGRVYVPCGFDASNYVQDAFLLSSTRVLAIATQWAAFLTDLDDNPGPDFADLRAAVVSNRGTDPGNWREIRGVRVGRVYDTQRRRRNNLDEDYTPVVEVLT